VVPVKTRGGGYLGGLGVTDSGLISTAKSKKSQKYCGFGDGAAFFRESLAISEDEGVEPRSRISITVSGEWAACVRVVGVVGG
jgi:hypothetical protein